LHRSLSPPLSEYGYPFSFLGEKFENTFSFASSRVGCSVWLWREIDVIFPVAVA
jgi:hypothetical protein